MGQIPAFWPFYWVTFPPHIVLGTLLRRIQESRTERGLSSPQQFWNAQRFRKIPQRPFLSHCCGLESPRAVLESALALCRIPFFSDKQLWKTKRGRSLLHLLNNILSISHTSLT